MREQEPISLITATSERPIALQLAKRWLVAQRLAFPLAVQWIIVDDGREPAIDDVPAWSADLLGRNPLLDLSIHYERKKPAASVPLSFRGNTATGLTIAQHNRIAFWEDDDHYPKHWLTWLSMKFDAGHELIGESRARYYNVRTRMFRRLANARHASLCQTACNRRVAKLIDTRCRARGGTSIDLDIWKAVPVAKQFLRPQSTVVGIKGLPGKAGIGIGHRRMDGLRRDDRQLSKLREWIGDDATHYEQFFQGE